MHERTRAQVSVLLLSGCVSYTLLINATGSTECVLAALQARRLHRSRTLLCDPNSCVGLHKRIIERNFLPTGRKYR